MKQLIKINTNDQDITLSGRELHEFLEIGTQYKDWFPRMIEYGFSEGEDFNPLKIEQVQKEGSREVKRNIIDHEIKLDMAKEIAMIQRNEKGKMARQYFLQIEKDWNSPEKIMARALVMAKSQIDNLKAINEENKPKVIFADAVAASHTSILVGELAKILKQNGVDTGQNKFFVWLRENGYLIRRKGTDYNMPTQRSMEQCLFEIKETSIVHADGHTSINKTPKVTGKGQQYFISKIVQAPN